MSSGPQCVQRVRSRFDRRNQSTVLLLAGTWNDSNALMKI